MVWKNIIILIFLVLINICFSYAKDLNIYFLDVGEGESTFIETPKDHTILIDTGNLITGFKIFKFLKQKNIKKIDYLIITHPHPDHCGGVFEILQHFQVINKFDNGENIKVNHCEDFYRWYGEIFRKGNYKILRKGDKLKIDNVILDVLSPEKLNSNWNENSLVIMVKFHKMKILLMADANKNVENKLLKENISLHADILKVGHHGAKDATSEEFLKAVNPKYAIISINKNNIRGYPSKKVLNLLNKNGISVLTTYDNGTIHCKLLRAYGQNFYLGVKSHPEHLQEISCFTDK